MHKVKQLFLVAFMALLPVAGFMQNSDSKSEWLHAKVDSLKKIPEHNHKKVLQNSDTLFRLAHKLQDTFSLQSLLSMRGTAFYYAGATDSAIHYFQKLAALDSLMNHEGDLANDLNNLAIFYSRKGKLEKAETYYRRNLKIYSKLMDKSGLATTYLNLGNINYNKGYINVALQNFITAHDFYKKIGDTLLMAKTNVNIGAIYAKTEDYKRAKERYKTALEYYERTGKDVISQTTCLNNLGELCLKTHKVGKALKYLKEAMRLAKENNNPSQKGSIFLGLVKIQEKYNLFQAARENSDSAMLIAQKINNPKMELRAWKHKADLLIKLNDYQKALSYLDKAQEIANTHEFINELSSILKSKQKALKKHGKTKQAYETLKEYRSIKDSLLSSELITRLSELKYRYDLEAEKRVNKALRQKNTIQELELQKLQNKNLRRNLIGIALLIIIAGLIYLKRRNNKKNRELTIRQGELEFTYEKLQQQENKTKAILNVLPDWVLVIDKNGDYTEIDKNVREEEKSTDSGNRNNIADIFPESTVQDLKKAINKLRKEESGLEVLDCNMPQNGDEEIFEARLVKINEDSYLVIARDMTLERKSLSEITKSRQELAESNKAKDRFLSILAHDLRGPFNALLGFSDLLHDDYHNYSDEEKKQFVKEIYKSSEHLFHLLVNLLHWTRMQTGKIKYTPHEQDIIKSIESACSEITEIAQEKDIQIKKEIPEELVINHDSSMIQGAVQNLLSNAVKYSNRGNTVWLKVFEKEQELIIEVVDEGIGIDMDQPEMLFRIDHQNKRAGTENESGTGLGLILCNEFISRHQGHLEIETEKDKGSTFRIILSK